MINEKIKLRVFRMPCCGHQFCWVNPRLPNHCPECGQQVYTKLKFNAELTLHCDDDAWIKYHEQQVRRS